MKLFITLLLFTYSLFSYPNISQAVKSKKIYPMGEKLYKKKCQTIDAKKYKSYKKMQEAIVLQKFCKPLNEHYFEALSLYLWDTTRTNNRDKKLQEINVTKDEKCPICGMFVYKYPKWASQIFYTDKHYSFDGVKDMMKFYFSHKKGITEILVRDYYSQESIDAQKAFYVFGSDVYGPMGNELIPFKREKSAKNFYLDHRGTVLKHFTAIDLKDIEKLDE